MYRLSLDLVTNWNYNFSHRQHYLSKWFKCLKFQKTFFILHTLLYQVKSAKICSTIQFTLNYILSKVDVFLKEPPFFVQVVRLGWATMTSHRCTHFMFLWNIYIWPIEIKLKIVGNWSYEFFWYKNLQFYIRFSRYKPTIKFQLFSTQLSKIQYIKFTSDLLHLA